MKTFRTALILAIVMAFFKFIAPNGSDSGRLTTQTTEDVMNQMQNEYAYAPVDDFSFLDINNSSKTKNSTSPASQNKDKHLKNNKKDLFIKMQILKKEIKITPPALIVDVKTNKYSPYFNNEQFFKIAAQAIIFTFCNQESNVFASSKRAYLLLNITNGLYSKSFKLNNKVCDSLDLDLLNRITDNYTLILKPSGVNR